MTFGATPHLAKVGNPPAISSGFLPWPPPLANHIFLQENAIFLQFALWVLKIINGSLVCFLMTSPDDFDRFDFMSVGQPRGCA